ncbi:MAG: carboxypeptidase regulatory-like domain-containing protein [Niabella sp.]|nr:carboxypeptidase regulatory-like domain-containing protein [Niabella sp.]
MMRKNKYYFIFTVALLASLISAAQGTVRIHGSVTDTAGRMLPYATLYIPGTSFSTTGNRLGNYEFNNLPGPPFQLAVSFVGYRTAIINIPPGGDDLHRDIQLVRREELLPDVVIRSDAKAARARWMPLFTKIFIGDTDVSNACRIENERAIHFSFDSHTGRLNAYADSVLTIRNTLLGYNVYYDLQNFTVQNAEDNDSAEYYFSGYARFQEMTGTSKQQSDWDRNRQQTYAQSSIRFLRKLYYNSEEDYSIHQVKEDKKGKLSIAGKIKGAAIVKTINGNRCLSDSFFVVDQKLKMQSLFSERKTSAPLLEYVASSVFRKKNPSDTIILLPDGRLFPRNKIDIKGYWGMYEKIATLLPYDYMRTAKKPESKNAPTVLNGVLSAERSLREKLYLHTDKNNYVAGDTIWFKSYLVDALTQLPVIRSGIEYVELIDENKEIIKRIALHAFAGTGFGDIAIGAAFAPGNYMLRAYTNWMQNFGDSLFFQKQFTIGGAKTEHWLVSNAPPVVRENAAGYDVSVVYQFKQNDLEPLRNQPITFFITDEKGKIIREGKLQTDYEGQLEAKFPLTREQVAAPVFAKIGNDKKDIRKVIPLLTGKNIDLQLLPESGHLMAGLPNTVGFKAIAEDGLGYDIKGVIKDNTGGEIISFQSLYKGLGSFNFIPEAGKLYTAFLQNGQQVPLPRPEPEGVLLHVSQNSIDTAIRLQIQATTAFANKEYVLQADAKGATVYREKITVKPDGVVLKFSKNIFPPGVVRFVLQNDKGQLLSERAIFVNNNSHQLNIRLQTLQQSYHPRDSVPVTITIENREGKPVMGTFSFAVTDDSQAKKDSRTDQNIVSYLLLQSDLKGTIETPGYYFSSAGAPPSGGRGDALDALMLTQGFVHYDWDTTRFKYEAEPEFTVKGKVTNGLNRGVEDARLILIAKGRKINFVRDTVSNKDGVFVFTNLPAFDTATFSVQAKRQGGGRSGLGVEIEQPGNASANKMVFQQHYDRTTIDSTLLNTLQRKQVYNQAYLKQKGTLPEVIIKTNIGIPGSFNLNGPGKADQTIGPEIIKPNINKNLYDLLAENVKGFGRSAYFIIRAYPCIPNTKPHRVPVPCLGIGVRTYAKIIIDGVDLEQFLPEPDSIFLSDPCSIRFDLEQPLRSRVNYLRSYLGSDVKGIEVFTSTQYRQKYGQKYNYGVIYDPELIGEILFVEVTTYSGSGPFKKTIPGQGYLYPQPFCYGKTFYTPRYNANVQSDSLPDYRSTVYWNPMVITNENGAAQVSFYTADLPPADNGKPITYTLWIEGIDLESNIGVKSKKIEVK